MLIMWLCTSILVFKLTSNQSQICAKWLNKQNSCFLCVKLYVVNPIAQVFYATSRQYPCPSMKHATEASLLSNKSSHTVPHWPLYNTSRRPEWLCTFPSSRTSIAEQIQVQITLLNNYLLVYTLCLKKVPTFKLSITLSNLNWLSNFLHCWKTDEICYKTIRHYPPYLRHVATLP